jgi:nucleoside-diphosphate-sugar epimerase
MTNTIMVTGAGGLVGRSVCRRLAAAGRPVVGLDRFRGSMPGGSSKTEIVDGDLLDLSSLLRRLDEWDVGTVVHAAAISHPTVSLDMPLATVQTNCVGTATLLEACRIKGVRRFIFLSSECVYGDQPDSQLDEREALSAGQVTIQYGGQYNQLIYVDDAARAIEIAVSREEIPSAIYNIGSGERITDKALGGIIGGLLDCPVNVLDTAAEPGLDQLGLIGCNLARRDLGFEPETALETGLQEYAKWLRVKYEPASGSSR